MNTFNRWTLMFIFLTASSAAAYPYKSVHEETFTGKSLFGYNYFLSEALESVSAEAEGFGSEAVVRNYTGLGLKIDHGIELGRYVQFSGGLAYHDLAESSTEFSNLVSLKAHAEFSFILYSPVVNVTFGGGGVLATTRLKSPDLSRKLEGGGYFLSVGLERYLSRSVSVFLNARRSSESLRPTTPWDEDGESNSSSKALKLDSRVLSLGLRLWL